MASSVSPSLSLKLEENVVAALAKAEADGADLTPAMAAIAQRLSSATRLNFKEQTSPLGVPWTKSKAAIDRGGLTLVDSGDLFGSIAEEWGADFAKAGPEASGGAAIYAAIYQWGGSIKRKVARKLRGREVGPPKQGVQTVEARPFVGWNDRLRVEVIDILGAHLGQAFGGGPAKAPAT
jgi:phage virion morphogenesis protein